MGMTAIEKTLARTGGVDAVRPGDIVHPQPDWIMIHDGAVMEAKRQLEAVGIDRLAAPHKVLMVTDHEVVYGSGRAAERGAFNRRAARDWGVGHFFDAGQGGHGHIFPMESGLVLPGMLYLDNDRHATNAGAVGAFGLRMGTEISRVLATGTNWVKVPATARLTLRGRLPHGVYARDVGFHLARRVQEGALPLALDYRVLEYAGDLAQFGFAERVALCSTPTEMGAYGVFVPPSEAILAFARERATRPFTPVYSDDDAAYEQDVVLDIGGLEPQVARPGGVRTSVDLSVVAGVAVDHAFVGSCGSGTWDDLVTAASLLEGRKVAPGVRMFVVPGSERSTRRLAHEGIAQVFLDAGAMLLPPGCGPCNDAVIGPLASGEVSISTATNSNTGRFGPADAKLYLGSPATVVASAVAGRIADPRGLAASEAILRLREGHACCTTRGVSRAAATSSATTFRIRAAWCRAG
jgi:3-isopropylmalate/(R)-2-methylmalate dehydratase large subunit